MIHDIGWLYGWAEDGMKDFLKDGVKNIIVSYYTKCSVL